jgi:E3 SUMO-protein ligase PIAS1
VPAWQHGLSNRFDAAVQFKPSPFYEEKSQIGDVKICEGTPHGEPVPLLLRWRLTKRSAMSQHRNTVSISFKPQDYLDVQRLVVDGRSYRIFIFCASDLNGAQDIAFPHQSELKVNGEDVRANLRGLKNKAGSTRPVDITNYLRCKHANYTNQINFTYALTNKKFYLAVRICKVVKVEELVARIQAGPRIRKVDVINAMVSKAKDADIEATSQVMSLKCPLSYMRLGLPCRGMGCKHVQCFDATSYLQLQEQGPQWLCPVCSNPARFDQLAVDEYVLPILGLWQVSS